MSLIFMNVIFLPERESEHFCHESRLWNVGRICGTRGDLSSQILLHAEWVILFTNRKILFVFSFTFFLNQGTPDLLLCSSVQLLII